MGADERARAICLQKLPPSPSASAATGRDSSIGLDCFVQAGSEAASEEPPSRCAPGTTADEKCTPYERSTDIIGLQFDGCDERDGGYGYPSWGQSSWYSSFPKMDLQTGVGGADTWYPW